MRLSEKLLRNRFEGPTAERLIKSDGYVAIGDDKQGTRVYHMLDSCLDRTYADMNRRAGTAEEDQLRVEYAALKRLLRHYEEGGLMGALGSADMEGSVSGFGGGRSFLAKTERQLNARDECFRAKEALSVGQWAVITTVVFNDQSLELAGYAIGRKSKTRAFEAGRVVLRGAGKILADMWKIS